MISVEESLRSKDTGTPGRLVGLLLAAGLLLPAAAVAGREGLPVAHTGAFGEPSCNESGCHRATLGGAVQSVEIDVGPYVPGAGAHPVTVTIIDQSARSWGFQLTARRKSNTALPAGTFAAINQFARVRCADNLQPPPCNANTLEYVSHTAAGAASGPAQSKTFAVNWTAPASDVGDIIFNVAVLGADGDLGTNGDRTATAQAVSLYAPSNTPTISANGAVNAGAPTGPNRSIAPGTLISLFGAKLAAPGTFRVVGSTDLDPQDRIPTELNRITVEFTSPPNDLVAKLGRILFVSDKQINLQTPDFFPSSGDTVRIQAVINRGQGLNEIRSNAITSDIRRLAPALFTLNSAGTGDAAAAHATGALVAASGKYPGSSPARAGETISIYGNGFGQTNPSFVAGDLPSSPATIVNAVTVEIGGLIADVSYKGVAPGFAGLYQFNVKIPNLPAGDHPIFIRMSNAATQPGVTIRVGQ